MPTIPYDMYESEQEIVLIIPFGGVKKESIVMKIQYETITISGIREKPKLRKGFETLQEQCFRWNIELMIDLPANANYKEMHSSLSKDNILTLIIPKNIIPDHIPVQIEE